MPGQEGGCGAFLPNRIELAATVYVAPSAVLLGHVRVGADSSIWPTPVLRGDYAPIEIGRETNVQDGSVLHVDQDAPCVLGDRVTVGHRAVVHGAAVEDDCLIGMGSVVLTGARVGTGSLVGAGAVVPEGMHIPPGSVVLGVPARVVRPVTPELTARIRQSAANYVLYAQGYREGRLG